MIILIPAKGVSSRIPHKNLQLLNGVSLVERAIRNAVDWFPEFETFVATEDYDIIDIAKRYGCSIFPLTADDIEDRRTVTGLIRELFRKYQEPVLRLDCTSPFTNKQDVIKAVEDPRDIVRSVWRGCIPRPQDRGKLTQHLDAKWVMTGNFTRVNRTPDIDDFYDESNFLEVDWLSALDINTPEDLECARRLFEIHNSP